MFLKSAKLIRELCPSPLRCKISATRRRRGLFFDGLKRSEIPLKLLTSSLRSRRTRPQWKWKHSMRALWRRFTSKRARKSKWGKSWPFSPEREKRHPNRKTDQKKSARIKQKKRRPGSHLHPKRSLRSKSQFIRLQK